MVPSVNTVLEDDVRAYLPAGVATNVGRVVLRRADSADDFAALRDDAATEAAKLRDASVDVMLLACGAATVVGGPDHDRHLTDTLSGAAGAPAVTMTGATLAALDQLLATDVVVVTPYPAWLHEAEATYLRAAGLVVRDVRLDLGPVPGLADIPPNRVFNAVVDALPGHADADAVVVACANLRALDAVEMLEERLGTSVVTGNQALLWAGLRALSLPAPSTWGALSCAPPLSATSPKES